METKRPPALRPRPASPLGALFLLCLFAPPLSAAIPARPAGRLNDFAAVLNERTKPELENLILQTERESTAEIAVVTVPSLEGMSVEEYAEKLYNTWGIGKKGKDNGVLVLVAPAERKMRIEVGYGLESILPDGLCGAIIRDEFLPEFKRGDYNAGILKGTRRIAAILAGNEPAAGTSPQESPAMGTGAQVGFGLFMSLFAGLGLFGIAAGLSARMGFFILWGSIFGGAPLAVVFLGPMGWLVRSIVAPFALLGWILGWRTGANHPEFFRGRARRAFAGGWVWGAATGGGGFSGGGFGGGFGGGSSGGGGASGSW